MAILERDILDYFSHIWTEANSFFESNVRPDWQASLDLYRDRYVWDKEKLDWQSRIQDPLADSLVTRLSNFLTRLLISTGDDYFTVNHKDSVRASGYRDLLSAILRDNSFPQIFNYALKYSLITSLYVTKVDYVYEQVSMPVFDHDTGEFSTTTELQGKVRIVPVSPFNIRLDPNGDSYIIEEKVVDLYEFLDMARANKWIKPERVTMSLVPPTSDEIDIPAPKFRPKVVLHYVYTKAVVDKNGQVLDRNAHFVVANKKFVVHYSKNLLPNGEFPYVVATPFQTVASRYGRGYLSKLRGIISAYIGSLNTLRDAFHLSTMGLFEYVVPSIVNSTEHKFTAKLRPGAFYPVQAPNTIRQIGNPQVPVVALNWLFFLDRVIQNRSFQTEFFTGMPTAKGRPTASEIMLKAQESTSFFTDIANDIEKSVLEPTLRLVLATELIYMDDTFHVDLSRNIKSSDAMNLIRSLSFNERIQDLKHAQVEVRGLSGKIQKITNLNKIIQIISVLGNMPVIAQSLDARKFLTQVFDAFDMSPEELFNLGMIDNLQALQTIQMMTGAESPEQEVSQ